MNLILEARKIGWVLLAGIACSAIVWGLSVPLTGMREPFDSPTYYYMVAMFIAGILAALPAPRYWWVAVIGIFSGERIYIRHSPDDIHNRGNRTTVLPPKERHPFRRHPMA